MKNLRIYVIGGFFLLAIIVVIVAFIFSGNTSSNSNNPPKIDSSKSNREVALSCTLDMYTKFHIHPNLQIIINGQNQVIPANIGIAQDCLRSIHTHDDTGKIHVESPVKRDFTLADFFAVWGKPFNRNQILNSKADDQHVIKQTINGKKVQDFENTIIKDGDQIVISYEH